jgi:hypothetical protein
MAAYAQALVTSTALTPAGRRADAEAASRAARGDIRQQIMGLGAGNAAEDAQARRQRRDIEMRNLGLQNQILADMEAEIRVREANLDQIRNQAADRIQAERDVLDLLLAQAAIERAKVAWWEVLRRKARISAAAPVVGDVGTSAIGTFSAAAAAGIAGGNSPEAQTAQNTAAMRADMRQLVNAANNGGLVFA